MGRVRFVTTTGVRRSVEQWYVLDFVPDPGSPCSPRAFGRRSFMFEFHPRGPPVLTSPPEGRTPARGTPTVDPPTLIPSRRVAPEPWNEGKSSRKSVTPTLEPTFRGPDTHNPCRPLLHHCSESLQTVVVDVHQQEELGKPSDPGVTRCTGEALTSLNPCVSSCLGLVRYTRRRHRPRSDRVQRQSRQRVAPNRQRSRQGCKSEGVRRGVGTPSGSSPVGRATLVDDSLTHRLYSRRLCPLRSLNDRGSQTPGRIKDPKNLETTEGSLPASTVSDTPEGRAPERILRQ